MSAPLQGPPPHFFIVGAPKCGTTSMAAWLSQHPEVFVIRGEPHFFGRDIAYNSPRMTPRAYRRLCRACDGKPVVGDRSTWYLFSQRAAAEIHAFNPEARIIAMLRDPADMIHSLHAHHYQRGRRDNIAGLAEALAAEPARRRGERLPANARFAESLLYSQIPRYAEQLERYLHRFGPERVHVLLLDDLRGRPLATYREVLAFLGVADGFEPDFDVHNRAAPAPDSLLRRIWKAGTWRYRVRSLLPAGLYANLRSRRARRLDKAAARQPRAPLDPALRARLVERFGDDIARLEGLIGRDLSAWRRV